MIRPRTDATPIDTFRPTSVRQTQVALRATAISAIVTFIAGCTCEPTHTAAQARGIAHLVDDPDREIAVWRRLLLPPSNEAFIDASATPDLALAVCLARAGATEPQFGMLLDLSKNLGSSQTGVQGPDLGCMRSLSRSELRVGTSVWGTIVLEEFTVELLSIEAWDCPRKTDTSVTQPA